MRPIDEKIIAMKMDNSDFVRKASETTSLFGKLRNSLNKIPGVNLGKTAGELSKISQNANGIKMDKLASSVDFVAGRFSAMGIVAVTTLQNITNRAVNAGIALGKSLSTDQLIAGFQEYELKMGSIQTILSNTQWNNTSLTDVKDSLEELNDYADKTIYNFAQMTQNIGRFTTAGVKLDDATLAIKGLSNLAADSGADANQLNTAMYQMSQAMQQPYMMLMDWRSLQNAGMGGKKVQDALLANAKAAGKFVDTSEGFNYSLKQGWLTTDIFLKTMKQFSEDPSMLDSATKVRTFTQLMDTLKESIGSGWAMSFEHMFGDFEEATEFWSNLSGSLTGWVDEMSESRNKFLGEMADGGGFENIFAGIKNALVPVGQVFTAIGDGFKKAFPPKSVDQVVKLTERFRDFTKGLKLSSDSTSKLSTIFQGTFSIFDSIYTIAGKLGGALLKLIPEGLGGNILDVVSGVAELAIRFNDSLDEGNLLTKAIDKLSDGLEFLGGALGKGIDSTIDFGSALKDNVGGAADWVRNKLEPLTTFIQENFGGTIDWIKDKLSSLRDIVKDVADGFGVEEVIGGGFLAGIFVVGTSVLGLFKDFTFTIRNFSDGFKGVRESVDGISGNMKDLLDGVGGALEAFQSKVKYDNLLKIAIAVGILAVSLKLLEGIKTEDVVNGIAALAGSMGVLAGGLAVIDRFNLNGGIRASVTIIALSLAMLVMATALKKISDLNPSELAKGIGGLVGITIALSLAVISISKLGGKIQGSSLKLIALATAILILTVAVERMAEIKTGKLFKAIGALGLIFAQLAIFLKIVDKVKFGVSSALGVLAIAGALHVMISAIEKINDIDKDALIKGLITTAIILAQLAIFSKVVSGGKLLAAGAGMILVAAAIRMLIGPITDLSEMSWEELAKGLGGMAIALAAVALAAYAMTGSIGGAAALILMATGLKMLMGPILAFASMSWGTMIKAFVGLAGGLALLAGASLLLTPAIPSMLGFGAAILVLGTALALGGAGTMMFGLGLTTLATMSATSIAAIISALGLLIKGLAELIPATVKFVVELGISLIDGIRALVPPLIELIAELILKLLETIAKYLPDFIDLGVEIVVQLIDGLGRSLDPLIDAGLELIISFIEALSSGIRDNGPRLVSAVMELLGEIVLLFITAGIEVINALFGWMPGVKEATAEIGATAEKYVRDNFGAKDVGKDKGKEFATALEGTDKLAKAAGKDVGESGLDGLDIDVSDVGRNFGNGFARGIRNAGTTVWSAAKSLAKKASDTVKGWLDINSPSRVTRGFGEYFGDGLALGIKDRISMVGKGAKDLALSAKDNLNKFIQGFELPEDDNELHFKAVVDYDAIDTGKFGSLSALALKPDPALTSSLMRSAKADLRQNGNNTPRDSAIDNSNTYNNQYDISVSANGTMSKSAVRKLAEDIQAEIKNIEDSRRISRGEEVAF